MYIGLISDTHGVFTDEFREFLAPVDQLWHAGDFGGGAEFAKQIADFKPLVGVYGNCDGQDIRADYPGHQFFECGGMKILMTHIGGYPGHYDIRARALIERFRPDIFVCGHSHILKIMYDERFEMLTLNPGAEGFMGWQTLRTALRFRLDGSRIYDMEVFKLPRNAEKQD